MKNKIIAALLAAALLPTSVYSQGTFTDMEGYDWALESVEYLHEKGIIQGVTETEYAPAAKMKRGDFALMIARYFELKSGEGENYSDVSGDTYYADALLSIKSLGAYDADTFEPERPITREEAMGLIYNVIYNTIGFSPTQFSEDAASYYTDAGDIKWDKVNAVATLTNMGIIEGDGGRFMPKDTMTRAQMAVVFFNLEEKGVKENSQSGEEAVENTDVSAEVVINSDISESGKQYFSSTENKSVVLVENAAYTATGGTLSKNAGNSSDIEKSRLNGLNSAFAARNATADMTNMSVLSSANGSDAVFASENSTVNIYDSALVTTGDYSSSAGATGGSVINIKNTRLSTSGNSSPALKALDGGDISCEGIYIMTSGSDSSPVYSAGKVTLNNSTISADNSYFVTVDGKGVFSTYGSVYSGGVMIFHSEKEGTQSGLGEFSAYNSQISVSQEEAFYVTNADAKINLTNTIITLPRDGILLKAEASKWGNEEANGGHASVNAYNQTLSGNIVTDGISSAELNLKGKSSYTGALNPANYTGAMNVSISSDSTWELTGDSYVNAIQNENTDCTNINSNGHNIYYDPSAAANVWLDGKTIQLNGGGVLKPAY
jgi:hypothetical protein